MLHVPALWPALRRGSFYHAGEQWMLHFEEKGGKCARRSLSATTFELMIFDI